MRTAKHRNSISAIRWILLIAVIIAAFFAVRAFVGNQRKQAAVQVVNTVCEDIHSGEISHALSNLSDEAKDGIDIAGMDTDAYMKQLIQAVGFGNEDSQEDWQALVQAGSISETNMSSLQKLHDHLQAGLLTEYTVDEKSIRSEKDIVSVDVQAKGNLILPAVSFTKAAEKANDSLLQYVDDNLPELIDSYEQDPDALKADLRNQALGSILPELLEAVEKAEPEEETWTFRVALGSHPQIVSITVS
jgi:hypothetical protein